MDIPLSEAQLLYYEDLKRQRGKRAKLLTLLMDGGWHPNFECAEIGGLSFNDSFFALREVGWQIESRKVKGGTWQFRLLGRNNETKDHKPMTVPQCFAIRIYEDAVIEKLGKKALEKVRAALPAWLRLGDED